MKHRLELSLAFALAVTFLCCAFAPQSMLHWWGVAFSPLCDGVLTADAAGSGIVLKSKLWELLMQLRA